MATTGTKKPSGRLACVSVERNGAMIQIDGVPEAEASAVLGGLLVIFRRLTKAHPELVQQLDGIGGGAPIDVNDGDDYETKQRRVGF